MKKPTLAEKIEHDIGALSRSMHKALRRRALLQQELTRLRIGQTEELTRARLADAGVKV